MRIDRRVLLMAVLMDFGLGEPPNRWHPVVWMGQAITWMRKGTPSPDDHAGSLAYGGMIAVFGSASAYVITRAAVRCLRVLPSPLAWMLEAWLLKTTFSAAGLARAGGMVEAALRAGDLAEARRLLSWHLVSRDTASLSEAQVAAGAVESVAENTSDSVIAPLLAYCVGGVPAAMAYRYVNTGDAMLGYRDSAREWLGKIPARFDDVLNFMPARLTALLFVALRPTAWRVWRRDAHKTTSPNAGHPMAAMAGALDVELEKTGVYTLNGGARLPDADDIARSRRILLASLGLFVGILMLFGGMKRTGDDA